MIVKATNGQAHRMAAAGISFVMLFTGCYMLDGRTAAGQLRRAGLALRSVK